MKTRFDLAGYRDLVANLLRMGYGVTTFDECASPKRGDLLLRHDVDYCLPTAVKMAGIEAAHDMVSTWFILVRSPLFNPFGAGERELLRSLRAKGGRIGLQFDAGYYPEMSDVTTLEKAASEEIAALEIASAGPVVAVSFHKPPPCLRTHGELFAGRPHCSEPRFMRDIVYCSDTLAQFSHGEPLDRAHASDLCAMQLLTHPIWWSESAEMSGIAKLDALTRRRADAVLDAIEDSVTAFVRSTHRPALEGKPQ